MVAKNLLLVPCLLAFATPARAVEATPMEVCQGAAAGAAAACKTVLDSPASSPNERAIAHLRLAWALGRDGALGEALRHADAAVGLAPNWFVAYNERAVVHLRARRYAAAIDDYDRSLALNAQAVYSLYGRGLARRALARGDAEADFAAARRLRPDIDAAFRGFGF